MSDAIARRNRDLGDFISGSPLSGYRARFAGHFLLERDDGVLTIRVHRDGQAARWSRGLLNAWNLLLAEVGADRDTQIMARPRTARRLTHGLITRTWQSRLVAELRDSYARQLLAMTQGTGSAGAGPADGDGAGSR